MTSKYTNKNGVKLLAAIMVLAVAVTGFIVITDDADSAVTSIEVKDADALKTAVESKEEANITLTADITITDDKLLLGANKTINLNNFKISYSGAHAFRSEGFNLTINGPGEIKGTAEYQDKGYSAIRALNGANVVINGVTITAPEYGVVPTGLHYNDDENDLRNTDLNNKTEYVTTLQIINSKITAGIAAVSTSGNFGLEKITIVNSELKSSDDVAIFIPTNASVSISNSYIEGLAGVDVRAGILNIKDSTISYTGPAEGKSSGDGPVQFGVGVAMIEAYTGYSLATTTVSLDNVKFEAGKEGVADVISGIKRENGKSFDVESALSTGLTTPGKTQILTIDGFTMTIVKPEAAVLEVEEEVAAENGPNTILIKGNEYTFGKGVVLDGTLTFGENNSATFKGIAAGDDGLTLKEGSIIIQGSTAVIEETAGSITIVSGTAKIIGDIPAGQTVTISKDATLVIDDAITNAGKIVNNGTMEINKKITSTGTFDVGDSGSVEFGDDGTIVKVIDSEEVEFFPNYEVGSTVTVDGITYTVFKGTSGKVEIQYGISCGDVPYTGKPITKYNVNLYSIPLTAEYSLTNQSYDLDPSQTYLDAKVYDDAVMVQLTFSDGTRSITMNEIIDLKVVPKDPKASAVIKGDDITYNELTGIYTWSQWATSISESSIEYTYDGKKYTLDQTGPVTVNYVIKNSLGQTVGWNDLIAGNYTITISFSEENNMAAAEVVLKITVTADPVDSTGLEIIEAEGDVLGVSIESIYAQMTITKDSVTPNKYNISAKIIKLEKFPKFIDEETDGAAGYYIVFTTNAVEGSTLTTAYAAGYASENGIFVFYLGNTTAPVDITLTYDQDGPSTTPGGEGSHYNPVEYTVAITFTEFKGMVVLEDKQNATGDLTSDVPATGAIFIFPNGAGTETAMIGWLAETGDFFAPGSVINFSNKFDANEDLRYVFKAVYEEPAPVETPVYNVYFVIGTDVIVESVKEGETITVIPDVPISEGIEFVGWFTDDEEFDFEDAVESDLVLVAVFEEKEEPVDPETTVYNVYFVDGTTVTVKTVEEGKTVEKIDAVPAEGLEFVGWYANGEVFDFTTVIEADTIVSAVYKAAEPVEPVEPVDPKVESEKYVVSTSVVDGEAIISIISLDGGYLAEGIKADVTFTVLQETTAFGQTVYKPVEVNETVTITDSKPIVESDSFDLEKILGDRFAVISVVSYIGSTNYGFMNIDYKN